MRVSKIEREKRIRETDEEIKLLETEKKNLLRIIYSEMKIRDKSLPVKIKIIEGRGNDTFKSKYPKVYSEILKNQIQALKTEIIFCSSAGNAEWRM